MTTFKVDGEVVQVSTGPTTLVLPEEPGDYSAWVLARGPHTYRAYWRMGLTEVDIIAEQTWELNFPQEQVTGHLFGLGD